MRPLSLTSVIIEQHMDRKKRSFTDFSLRWLAKKLEVSPAYVSQIVSGKRNLRPDMVGPLCEILDIDSEKQELISIDLLRNQGWSHFPKQASRGADLDGKAHKESWESASINDLSVLATWDNIVVLEATQLKDYDGTPESLSQRLEMDIERVKAALSLLGQAGFLAIKDGRLMKTHSLLEFQSRMEKSAIRSFHKQVLQRAQTMLDEKTSDTDIEARLITSSTMTVSKEHIPLLRAKMAEFIREIGAETAIHDEDELYQFALAFFPVSKKKDR